MWNASRVDLLDVRSGDYRDQKFAMINDFQVGIVGQIWTALREDGIGLLIGAMSMITYAKVAKSVVEEGKRLRAKQNNVRVNEVIEVKVCREILRRRAL